MPANMVSQCSGGLECVYTFGPMIADAPGMCRPRCETIRDQWGNCVPDNCEVWNDGCNACEYDKESNSLINCSEDICYAIKRQATCERYSTNINDFFHCSQSMDALSEMNRVCCADNNMCLSGFPEQCSPECASLVNLVFTNCKSVMSSSGIDTQEGSVNFHNKCLRTSGSQGDKAIDLNCAVWYDGCNVCSVNNGDVQYCSRRTCLSMGESSCRAHHTNVTSVSERGGECFDGIDNDNDGLSDCNDPDCLIYGRCRQIGGNEEGRDCFDGIDNDNDGLSDCNDPDCIKDPRASRRCPIEIREMTPVISDGPIPMPPVSVTTINTNGHKFIHKHLFLCSIIDLI